MQGNNSGVHAYLDWSGALLSVDSTISQIIQPLEVSPQMYWEAGWHWDNVPDGGYGGIQSKGILADGTISDLAIFLNLEWPRVLSLVQVLAALRLAAKALGIRAAYR
jgi:hypothetical protein